MENDNTEQDLKETEDLISDLTGQPANIETQPSSNIKTEYYQLPVQVGQAGKPLDQGDKPWIVGYFSPNAPTDANHKFHNGIDLKAPKGTPIYPIASGVVKETGVGNKSGNYVMCLHEDGGVQSFYAHMDSIAAKKGDKITQQTVLGTVGDSGNAINRGSHCHWECKVNGSLVNPLSIIGKQVGSLVKKANLLDYIEKMAEVYFSSTS